MHVFAGTDPGPTLLVQAAIHGSEIIGSMAILNFIKKLDPSGLCGNIIAVPVVNRMGFELSERGSKIDGKDISRLFPGNPKGSVSDQVAYVYFEEVIRQANVMIDFHAGAQVAYERYVLFTAEADPDNLTEIERKRRKLIVAFGLDQAAFFPPGTFGANKSKEAIEGAGVVQFTLEFGGGTGWFANGEDNVRDAERGIWNTMKAMRMIDGAFESDGPLCTVYNAAWSSGNPRRWSLHPKEAVRRVRQSRGDLRHVGRPVYGRGAGHDSQYQGCHRHPQRRRVADHRLYFDRVFWASWDRVEDRRTADLYVTF